MNLNEYDNKLSADFQKSDVKPDKQFSFLPTVLGILGNLKNKTVLDLGCGDGFFTRALASMGAKKVIGIDNSEIQLKLAKEKLSEKNIEYEYGDIFRDKIPQADVILSPFVLNYAENIGSLEFLFKNIWQSLSDGGKVLFVVDLPKGNNLKKFGSLKTLENEAKDGTRIKIDLYNGDDFICTLYSIYYTPKTLENYLVKVGFKNIKWHKPVISKEGIDKFGKDFWEGFSENSELGYLSAEK